MNQSRILSTLMEIDAVDGSRIRIFADNTRDADIPVKFDPVTGVIFIEDFYVGDEVYVQGEYRNSTHARNFDDVQDTKRRLETFSQFIHGNSVIDFGCGEGNFLKAAALISRQVQGVELQGSSRRKMHVDGLACYQSLEECSEADVVVMFHVLEHLPDPLATLALVRSKMTASGSGTLIVEVPHARDFLLNQLANSAFRDFTLWSQHLILHTRDSLDKLLRAAGFTNVQIVGVQRYGLANHLSWLSNGTPGGHKEPLSMIETASLKDSYAASLSMIDANDTLVAIAR